MTCEPTSAKGRWEEFSGGRRVQIGGARGPNDLEYVSWSGRRRRGVPYARQSAGGLACRGQFLAKGGQPAAPTSTPAT